MREEKKNYTAYEQNLLLELVDKHKDIVENKETNAVWTERKTKEWEKIAKNYNSDPTVFKRNSGQLSKKWKNMKRIGCQDIAEERRKRLKTGGGPEENSNSISARIAGMVHSQVYPLENEFDDDAGFHDLTPNVNCTALHTPFLTDSSAVQLYMPPSPGRSDQIHVSTSDEINITTNSSSTDTRNTSTMDLQNTPAPGTSVGQSRSSMQRSTMSATNERPTLVKKRLSYASKVVSYAEEEHKKKMELLEEKIQAQKDERNEEKIEHDLKVKSLEFQIQYWKKMSDRTSDQLD